MHHHMAKCHKEHNYQPTLYGIDDLLNDMFGRMTDFSPAFLNTPDQKRLELEVGKENIVARLAVPGCTPADVSVEVLGDYLTVKASHHCNVNPDNDKHFIRRERSFDSYEETVRLPVKVKGAETKAKCADGVLTVTLPREDAVKPASHIVNVQ